MSKHRNPALTVDIIIIDNDNTVLIKRLNDPYKDHWALPGGFVEYGEKVEHAAVREAKEETGLEVELDKLVGVYSDPDRDPRGHTVTVVFTAHIIDGTLQSDSDAKDAKYIKITELKNEKLAFDHEEIITDAGLIKDTQ
ncbi:NUDIX hydrolase [Methanosphaera sp. Vir-13MRS]|uniref:NUDIX hydrolase n=1 Tax=Candidatus Methanosphaera massiliense TaxID=3017187 RepID=UPI002380085B|nr:NUDIX hydrolase [Candidatus Methanosphaera massiliense]MDE4077924.1 NUDIX hydrolase [Candidatus Methanosphaera massiliense]